MPSAVGKTTRKIPQTQLDLRALEMATIAKDQSEKTFDMLNKHVESCSKMQRSVFGGVLVLLIGMLGVLIKLYVLPGHGG